MSEHCTSVFLTKTLKSHRENVLFDREKSLLPETQPYVVVEIQRKNIKKQIDILNVELFELRRQERIIQDKVSDLQYTMNRLTINNIGESSTTVEDRKKFVRKCPLNECRGFLSTAWKCGSCEKRVCNKCNEEKLNDHECLPENVASMELLNKDTKPCPRCGTMIFRISGCFEKDVPIMLWNGTIKMSQNITIGDNLIGDDGNIRTVLDTTTGIDTLYNIIQSDGISYTVNSKHTLLLKPISNNVIHYLENLYIVHWFNHSTLTYSSKKFSFDINSKSEMHNKAVEFSKNLNIPDYLQIKVEDYMKLPEKIKSKLLGFKSEGVNWEHRDIKIDPYLLGLWLGDGNSNGTGFASNDNEIIQYFIDWANKNELFIVHQDKYFFQINSYLNTRKPIGYEENCLGCIKKECNLCFIENNKELVVPTGRPLNIFRKLLGDYSLINNKHIPDDYLMNSRENRLKLLAGIIDTDGCVRNEGKRIIITQVNIKLSEQIIILAKSLGFIVHHRIVKKINIPFPNTDKLTDCKDQYQINISGNIKDIPTILSRKKCVSSNPNKDYKRTSITVSEVGKGKYYGFLLDNNHNFILSDFTCAQNCSQMFCTDCHTAWDWNTQRVVTGVIHNPHYYEFLNKNGGGQRGRNHGDIPCGGLPDAYEVRSMITNIYPYDKAPKIMNIHNCITHIQQHELRNHIVEDPIVANRDLRVKYLMNDIPEAGFKATLQQAEKKRQKTIAFRNIYQMFVDVGSDVLRQVVVYYRENQRNNRDTIEPFINENFIILNNLIDYFNESLKKIGKMYKCVYPGINKTLIFTNNIETYNRREAVGIPA